MPKSTLADAVTGHAVGWYSSLAILPNGWAAISHCDPTGRDLRYAWREGDSSTWSWDAEIVDLTADDVGWGCSLAILASGHPAISYHDRTNHAIKYASPDGLEVVGNTCTHGDTSLAILPTGRPVIAYICSDSSPQAGTLKYATLIPDADGDGVGDACDETPGADGSVPGDSDQTDDRVAAPCCADPVALMVLLGVAGLRLRQRRSAKHEALGSVPLASSALGAGNRIGKAGPTPRRRRRPCLDHRG